MILKKACEYLVDNRASLINPEEVYGDGGTLGLSRDDVKDSVEILETNGYLDVSKFYGGGKESYSFHFRVSTYGFENFAQSYIPDYQEIVTKVISAIVNDDLRANDLIANKIGEPITIIDHIFHFLEAKSQIRLGNEISRRKQIFHVAASLKRLLQ